MNLPSMPGFRKQNSGESKDSLPFTEDSANAESEVEISSKPQIINPQDSNDSQVDVKASKKGIEVVATRKGFYNGSRLKEGDSFIVKSEEDLGEWMKCVDRSIEKKRVEILNSKKAKK